MMLANDDLLTPVTTSEEAPIRGVVLVVDDHPDILALIAEVLGGDGYTVMAAIDGASALERARLVTPDIVLLDARMPGLDGFEVCRRLVAAPALAHTAVIFMTGLTDSDSIVRGFRAGGADYVTKPLKPDEVRVRVDAHLARVRARRRTEMVLDAGGRAALIATPDGRIRWHSSRAAGLMARYFGASDPDRLPAPVQRWLAQDEAASRAYEIGCGQARLSIHHAGPADGAGVILTLVEADEHVFVAHFVERFGLTRRQAEVLLWIARGKTNRDIGEILAMSPRTVNKHLEHIFPKLGVETRAAAAAVALQAASF